MSAEDAEREVSPEPVESAEEVAAAAEAAAAVAAAAEAERLAELNLSKKVGCQYSHRFQIIGMYDPTSKK